MDFLPIVENNPAAYHIALLAMTVAAIVQTLHSLLSSFDDETPTYRPRNLRMKAFFWAIFLWLIVATIAAKLKML